jgi:hypothetical protein
MTLREMTDNPLLSRETFQRGTLIKGGYQLRKYDNYNHRRFTAQHNLSQLQIAPKLILYFKLFNRSPQLWAC